jgi:large subunit ribosomal protein L15
MSDFNLHAPEGSNKRKRIVGRGQGSGSGTTAGRGNKGQQSRSGGKTYPGFEGGQMPLYRRIPHRGFSNTMFRKDWQVVNLCDLEVKFAAGETVDGVSLMAKRLVKKADGLVKILGNGELTKALKVSVDKVSAAAAGKIKAAGGTVETPDAQGTVAFGTSE